LCCFGEQLKTFLFETDDGEKVEKIQARILQRARLALGRPFISANQLPLVEVISDTLTIDEMATLYSNVHAFVLPTRAEGMLSWCIVCRRVVPVDEPRSALLISDCSFAAALETGWCLPAAQALAAGLPTIVTNWSGPGMHIY
jgi:hypothetical protein